MNLTDYPTPETDKFRDSLDSIRPDGTHRIDAFAEFARKIEQQRDHNRRIYETEVKDALFGQNTLKRVINERDKALSEAAAWKAVAEMYRKSESVENSHELLVVLDEATEAFDVLKSQLEKP